MKYIILFILSIVFYSCNERSGKVGLSPGATTSPHSSDTSTPSSPKGSKDPKIVVSVDEEISTPEVNEQRSSAPTTICYPHNDFQYDSYLFFQEEFGEKYQVDTFYRDGNRICIQKEIDGLYHYFVLPSGGRVTQKEQLLESNSLLDFHNHKMKVIYDNSMDSIMTGYQLERCNKALKALRADFQFTIDTQKEKHIGWSEGEPYNGFSNMMQRGQVDTFQNKHFIIADNEVFEKVTTSALGLHSPFSNTVNLYFGKDSLLYNQWLTLHELCHMSVGDEDQDGGLTVLVGDELISIADLQGNQGEFCEYYISPRNIFTMHGLNLKYAPDEPILFAVDTEAECIDFTHPELPIGPGLANIPCLGGRCHKVGTANYFMPRDILLKLANSYKAQLNRTAFFMNDAKVKKHVQTQWQLKKENIELQYLNLLNAKMGTSFGLKDLKNNEKMVYSSLYKHLDEVRPIFLPSAYNGYNKFVQKGEQINFIDNQIKWSQVSNGLDKITLVDKVGVKKEINVSELINFKKSH